MVLVSKPCISIQLRDGRARHREEKHWKKPLNIELHMRAAAHTVDIGHGIQFSSWIQFNSVGYLHCYCFYLSQVKYKPFGFHGCMASASLRRTNGYIGLNNSYSIVNLINSVKHCLFFYVVECVVLLSFFFFFSRFIMLLLRRLLLLFVVVPSLTAFQLGIFPVR